MPNAKDIDKTTTGRPKFLLLGNAGAGKTTQILTLPGKTFAYFFDPSALSAIQGYDIDYEIFVPSVVNMSAQSLSKGKGDPITLSGDASETYLNWERDFEEKLKTGYLADYDNIVFDSLTTFNDVVMDRILDINNRVGRQPQHDDYAATVNTIRNVFRTISGQLGKIVICIGHVQLKQDEVSSRILNQIMVVGQLRVKLPLLFSDMLYLECKSSKTEVKYVAQTRPDRMNPAVRCSFKGLDFYHDLTIPVSDKNRFVNPQNYGIGKLLKDNGFYSS